MSRYFNDFSDTYGDSLEHHGIKGQKQGVRRYQNPDGTLTIEGKRHYGVSDDFDGRILSKNTKFYRITNEKEDTTYGGRKYVSTNKADHEAWQKYIGDAYAKEGYKTYNVMYMPVKDLKIAKATKTSELFTEAYLKDHKIAEEIIDDTNFAKRKLGYSSGDMDDMLHLNFAMQTKTGQMFINRLLDLGYDGIEDKHGQNTSKDPIIIFNPEQNIKKKNTTRYK